MSVLKQHKQRSKQNWLRDIAGRRGSLKLEAASSSGEELHVISLNQQHVGEQEKKDTEGTGGAKMKKKKPGEASAMMMGGGSIRQFLHCKFC